MKNAGYSDHCYQSVRITWRRWQVSLAGLCLIIYFAVAGWGQKTGTSQSDRPVGQVAQDDRETPVWSVVFSDRTHLASTTTNELWLTDVATGKGVRLLDRDWYLEVLPAFSPGGQILAVGGSNSGVRLWDVGTGVELTPLRVGTDRVRCVTFSPDGTTLAVSTWNSSVITLWDWHSRRRLAVLDGHRGVIKVVAFSPDGRTLLAANFAAEVVLWDIASREKRVFRRVHNEGLVAVAFSPDSRLFATANHLDPEVRLWDSASGEPRESLPTVSSGMTGIAFSPDGTKLATSQRNGFATLWDLASGERIGTVISRTGSLQAIAFSADGNVFATGGFDGAVRRWNVAKVVDQERR